MVNGLNVQATIEGQRYLPPNLTRSKILSIMSTPQQLLNQGIDQLGLNITPQAITQLEFYILLCKMECCFNLTAIREPKDIVIKHFFDH